MKELADRDIKKYELPKREKLVTIDVGEDCFNFVLKRPSLRDRNALAGKYNLIKEGDKLGQDETKLRNYMNDVILMMVVKADKNGEKIEMVESAFGDWDSAVYELLFSECLPMMGLGEKDKYFRKEGDTPK